MDSGKDRLDREQPALVVGRPLVGLGWNALDPAPQLVDVHQPAPGERAGQRIGQDLPVLERVFAAIDPLVGSQTATIVDTALHAADPTVPVAVRSSGGARRGYQRPVWEETAAWS